MEVGVVFGKVARRGEGLRPALDIETRDLMFRTRRRRTGLAKCPRARSWRLELALEALEPRQLLSSFVVGNTADSGSGSLRAAIIAVNADLSNPVTDNIMFDIPASTAPAKSRSRVSTPVTQTWKITLDSPLPPITHSVSIDGYTQAHFPIPYLYPNSISSAVQTLSILGSPTGGTFTLTTSAPLPVGTTAAIPYTADAGTVQNALAAIIGAGNVVVTGGPLPSGSLTITFEGAFAQQAIPNLSVTNNNLTGGTSPSGAIATSTIGGVAGSPTLISSVPNTVAALQGNNAQVRVIIDGSLLPSGPTDIGFAINASDSILRGLAIEGFSVGVSVPNPTDVGDLIQGNFIGDCTWSIRSIRRRVFRCRRRIRSSSPGWVTRSRGWFWARRTQPWAAPSPRTTTSSPATGRKGCCSSPARRATRSWGIRSGWLDRSTGTTTRWATVRKGC